MSAPEPQPAFSAALQAGAARHAKAALEPRTLSSRRKVVWVVGGILLPLLAFAVDANLKVDPLIWPRGAAFGPSGAGLGVRQLTVYTLLGLSMLGLGSTLFASRSRVGLACALPLLLLGVLVAGAHALVFIPLLPLSVMALIMAGLGLLGLTPFLAVGVYVDALRWALDQQARVSQGRLVWALAPLAATALVLAVAVGPLWQQEQGLATIRQGGDATAVSTGFRELGALASLSRLELRALYTDLDAEGQIRLRNLYFERFGVDVNQELGRGFR